MDDKLTLILFLVGPPLAGEALLLFLLFRLNRHRAAKLVAGRVLLFNALSVLLMLILSFLGGELYYRLIYDTTDSIAYTKVSQQWVKRYVVENSAGFRDNIQYALPIAPGKRRVSFLGDSFTVGHGVKSVEDRFPNLLRADHPDWEVHVLAKLGWDTGMELRELEKYLNDGYQPDLVVLVYCLNDVADLFPEWSAALHKLNAESKQANWLRRHSYFLDILHHRRQVASNPQIKNYYDFVKRGYEGAPWELQQQRLIALKRLVEIHRGRLAVITFPFLQSLGESYDYRLVHEQLARFWSELGVSQLDLLPVFDGMPSGQITVNRYDPHPNEQANALAAKAIDTFLITQLNATSNPTNTAARLGP